jgi:ribosomal silencing factor RsfS
MDSPPTKELITVSCVCKMMATVFLDASGVQLFVDFFLISETATEEHYCKMLDSQKETVETKRLGW